jgi:hypothetical protein
VFQNFFTDIKKIREKMRDWWKMLNLIPVRLFSKMFFNVKTNCKKMMHVKKLSSFDFLLWACKRFQVWHEISRICRNVHVAEMREPIYWNSLHILTTVDIEMINLHVGNWIFFCENFIQMFKTMRIVKINVIISSRQLYWPLLYILCIMFFEFELLTLTQKT